MKWILVSGGVHSGIGKGSLASTLGRAISYSGHSVDYLKIEPCLEGEISDMPNTVFGEIVMDGNSTSYDADLSRAKFFMPGYEITSSSHLSLGKALDKLLKGALGARNYSPRLVDVTNIISNHFKNGRNVDFLILELGGTAGEPEHNFVLSAIIKSIGNPVLHLHLTAIVKTLGQRQTSKPSQLSLNSLSVFPDIVLVRAEKNEDQWRKALAGFIGPFAILYHISESPWPEKEYYQSFFDQKMKRKIEMKIGVKLTSDPLFQSSKALEPQRIIVLNDGGGKEAYQNLIMRINTWGRGAYYCDFVEELSEDTECMGVVRIGEKVPRSIGFKLNVPILNIVPIERGKKCRSFSDRPDWHGTADEPCGPLYDFIKSL